MIVGAWVDVWRENKSWVFGEGEVAPRGMPRHLSLQERGVDIGAISSIGSGIRAITQASQQVNPIDVDDDQFLVVDLEGCCTQRLGWRWRWIQRPKDDRLAAAAGG